MLRHRVFVGCVGCLLSFSTPLRAAEDWQGPLRTELNAMADRLTATLKPWPVPPRDFRVEDYGAVADGQTVNTPALQKAIDTCSAAGGGTVRLSKGDYVTGTLELKSGVMLQIDKDARLLGSVQLADPAPGKVRRLLFEHITGQDNGGRGSAIVGAEGDPVEEVAVNDCHLSVGGGGTAQQAASVPKEKPTSYPEAPMYGSMYPAYGFYVWHARDVQFNDLAITPQKPDARPGVNVGPDVQNVLLDGQPVASPSPPPP